VVLGRAFPTTTPQDVSFVGIVPGAFLVVGEDFVCRLDLGKEGSGALRVAMVAVGVEFQGLLAVCLLQSEGC
jgi:hypothetical protein